MFGVRLFAYSFLVVSVLAGCNRDLGECNLTGMTEEGRPIPGPAAFDLVYRSTDGLPMYEGQALVQSTCGNGQFCHSPAAVRGDRIGVPAGLDFDVALACTDETVDSTCADLQSCEGAGAGTDYCDRLKRLADNRGEAVSQGEEIISQVRKGAMPPGDAGQRVRDPAPWLRPDGGVLPAIESDDGKEIVRNWLACQAPVVARTEFAPMPILELSECESIDGEICIYSGPQELIEPTWSSIYANLVFTQCLTCHAPPNQNPDQNPDNPFPDSRIPGGASDDALAALDLSGENLTDTSNWASDSYDAVVNALAADPGACAGDGTIVIPMDSANSIMIQKMRAMQTCGTEMPPAGGSQTISEVVISVVEDWIEMGAPNN